MKIAALDIGDRWTGVALSDPLGIIARPFTTIETEILVTYVQQLIDSEKVTTIVIGYPRTMRGTISEQTQKTDLIINQLKKQFPDLSYVLWDERLTSKQALRIGTKRSRKPPTKEEKLKVHARAAALILQSYLENIQLTNRT